jgi:hypothetical protein
MALAEVLCWFLDSRVYSLSRQVERFCEPDYQPVALGPITLAHDAIELPNQNAQMNSPAPFGKLTAWQTLRCLRREGKQRFQQVAQVSPFINHGYTEKSQRYIINSC